MSKDSLEQLNSVDPTAENNHHNGLHGNQSLQCAPYHLTETSTMKAQWEKEGTHIPGELITYEHEERTHGGTQQDTCSYYPFSQVWVHQKLQE